MSKRKKDPKKVAAGKLGGKVSGGNWKHNKDLARRAGRISAWKRNGARLEDYPLEYEDMPIEVPKSAKREGRRLRLWSK